MKKEVKKEIGAIKKAMWHLYKYIKIIEIGK